MRLTLLEMVQDILNDIDGDVVNSIGDTEESLQVAQIIKTTYAELITLKDLPHLRKVTTLTNISDITKPNYLKLPARTSKLLNLYYDTKRDSTDDSHYKEVHYKYPDEFIMLCNGRDATADNIEVVTDFDGAKLNIINDQAPTYWTSFDDEHVIFDSWPSDLSTTLIEGNSQAIIYQMPKWNLDDLFVPDLPAELFPGLLAEAKSASSFKLRQVADQKAEQQSVRQQRLAAQRGWKAKGGIRYANYGRRTKGIRTPRLLPKYFDQ